ncbi:MAG TPA: PilN domain-containing protein [Polyangia bacterium]|nr:PilN domain-containing protein [Polyangia bacterium]
MTLGELSQRLRRADFLDGLGIYVGAHEVALAHVTKRFFQVRLRNARTYPLPGTDRPAERRQALAQAVATFAQEHRVDTRRATLCLSRAEAAFNRVLLPAAAAENVGQVIEYEIEHLIPLPREQVYFDFSARPLGQDRLEVLLMCIPREVVRGYLDALEEAFVRPRGIVLASTAIADYVAFCRGQERCSLGLVLAAAGGIELALVNDGRLVASQLLPEDRGVEAAAVERSLARELSDAALAGEDVPLYRWQLANGTGPPAPDLGDGDLPALAAGRLEAPPEFLTAPEPGLLPAVGAALGAVREATVPMNLLPAEGRRRSEEGLSLTTVVLVGVAALLLLVWGGSALVKDELLRRQIQEQVAAVQPQVRAAKALQDEIAALQHHLAILTAGQDHRVTLLLKELTELVPADAYLTSLNLRAGRLTIDGQARSASDLIAALEKSRHFKNVSFTSPTTRSGDKERFSIVAEVEK